MQSFHQIFVLKKGDLQSQERMGTLHSSPETEYALADGGYTRDLVFAGVRLAGCIWYIRGSDLQRAGYRRIAQLSIGWGLHFLTVLVELHEAISDEPLCYV